VRFGKPVVLPARAGLYVDRTVDGWELTLRICRRVTRT
jgi:hypothetical protein